MATIGFVSDIHGDLDGFLRALRIFEREQVTHMVCAGDIVDRGADADRIVEVLQRLPIVCIKGNHEDTILRSQESLACESPPPPISAYWARCPR